MTWQKRAVCPCGENFRASFADLFFVHEECCPKCGCSKSKFEIRTIRWVPATRTAIWPFGRVIEDGHWEDRDKPKEPSNG